MSTPELTRTYRLHRIIGPPGCGKTTELARQAARASLKFGGDRLIVASLTRAAAAEVAGRDTGIPRKNVGTLHAHAFRALRQPELAETPAGLKAWNDRAALHLQLDPANTRDPEWANPEEVSGKTDADKAFQIIGILRAQMIPAHRWPVRVRAFWIEWEAWKRATMRLDFSDLIERAAAIPHPFNPRIVFLDEAQDMSLLEMTLALHWASDAEQTVIVGDPDQCLFEWRGSSQAAFFAPEADSERVLSQSYRVPRSVHAYAVRWIEGIRDRPPVAYLPRPADGSVESIHADYYRPEPILAAIARQPAGETSMILATCAYMLDHTIRQLREEGTPFHNPYRVNNGRWNPLAAAARPLALLRPCAAVWGDEARIWTWDELHRWLAPTSPTGWLMRGIKTDVEGVCKSGEGKAEERVPLDYIASMFKGEDAAEAKRDVIARDPLVVLRWWASRLRATEARKYEYALTVAERHGAHLLRETPRIIVGTIHSVKGGEADTVYVFPDISLAAWTGSDGAGGWAYGGSGRDPTYRLFYVAFTRARSNLRLAFAQSNLAVPFPAP